MKFRNPIARKHVEGTHGAKRTQTVHQDKKIPFFEFIPWCANCNSLQYNITTEFILICDICGGEMIENEYQF